MIMAMMRVRIMQMFVRHLLMPVPMTMTRSRRHGLHMGMLMMDPVLRHGVQVNKESILALDSGLRRNDEVMNSSTLPSIFA